MISAEARGRLREFKERLAAEYQKLDAMQPVFQQTLADFVYKRGKGRQRVFDRLDVNLRRIGARLEGVRLDGNVPVVLWSMLKAREAVLIDPDDPRDDQNCVCVNYIAYGALPADRDDQFNVADGLWTIEFTDHALGRYLDRCRVDDHRAALLNLREALFDAHHALLNVDYLSLQRFEREPKEILLNAKSAAWAIEMRLGDDIKVSGTQSHVIARTSYDYDQLSTAQEARLLKPASVGERLGEAWFAPHPFRRIVKVAGGFRAAIPTDRPLPFMPVMATLH